MRKRILSTSRNATVLRTRNLVLISAGYEVVSTLNALEFRNLVASQNFDLAVLGDSIEFEERIDLARQAKVLKPDLPLLIFFRTPAEAQQLLPFAHSVIGSLDGPERLIASVRAALGEEETSRPPKRRKG